MRVDVNLKRSYKWEVNDLETINIIQEEPHGEVNIFKLDGTKINYIRMMVFVEVDDVITVSVISMNGSETIEKYYTIGCMNIGGKKNGNK